MKTNCIWFALQGFGYRGSFWQLPEIFLMCDEANVSRLQDRLTAEQGLASQGQW